MLQKTLLFFCLIILCKAQDVLPDSLLTDEPLKNPTKALLYSAILPGAGQVYDENYFRSVIAISSITYFISVAINADNDLDKVKNDPLLSTEEIRSERNKIFDIRNVAIWRTIGLYTLNLLDAYIGAYMFKFDERMGKAKISFGEMTPTQMSINLKIEF